MCVSHVDDGTHQGLDQPHHAAFCGSDHRDGRHDPHGFRPDGLFQVQAKGKHLQVSLACVHKKSE